jgi:opacity protein-like surface antigen
MRRMMLLAGCGVGLLLAGSAAAQSADTYAQFTLGSGVAGQTKITIPGGGSGHEDLQSGIFTAAAVGETFPTQVSVEGEILYLRNNINTDDLDFRFGAPLDASARTIGGLANARYTFAPVEVAPFSFSAGAGVGYGETRYQVLGQSLSKSGFMWQAMADIGYPMSDKLTWDLQYRYVRSPDVEDSWKLETGTHVIAVGARMKF